MDFSRGTWLLADDLDQHALFAAAVELAVEDLLPGPEVQLAGGHRYDHFTAHHLALDMRVSVVFAGSVVMVMAGEWSLLIPLSACF